MHTIIGIVMGLAIAFSGANVDDVHKEVTTITNPREGTRMVITRIGDERYVENYEFNYQTYDWELIEEA